jgi:predicted hotdog family 3-hydroxylacyl-ACP dehydratase
MACLCLLPFCAGTALYRRFRLRYRGDLQTGTDTKKRQPFFQFFFAMDVTRIAVETLLPHRGRMKLVEEIAALDEEHAVTRSVVRSGWPLCDGRSVSAIVLIELVAQTAGINNGWVRIQRHGPAVDRKGWIVGISRAALHADRLEIGTRLTVRAENSFAFEGFREIQGTVEADGDLLAEVTLLLLRSETEPLQSGKGKGS